MTTDIMMDDTRQKMAPKYGLDERRRVVQVTPFGARVCAIATRPLYCLSKLIVTFRQVVIASDH